MFAWNVHYSEDAKRFVLTVPLHYGILLVIFLSALIACLLLIKHGHLWRNLLVVAVILFLVEEMTFCSRLTMDREAGTVTFGAFQFFHWNTRTFPIDSIAGFSVRTGNTSDALEMQLTSGSMITLSLMDQYGGKEKMAYLANQFLHGGGEQP